MTDNIIVYTFRTFPDIETIREYFPNLIVLGKLKMDIQSIFDRFDSGKVDIVLGVARSDKRSRSETMAVNKFNNKNITLDGADKYRLDVLAELDLTETNNIGTSFCNWSAYKIAEYIQTNELKTRISFIHINENDTAQLMKKVKEIYE